MTPATDKPGKFRKRKGKAPRPRYVVRTWHDDAHGEDPSDWGGWEVIPFNRRRFRNAKDPDTFGLTAERDASGRVLHVTSEDPEIAAKLANGTAFLLDYFEHGLCAWQLAPGEFKDPGDWDTSRFAGVLVFQGEPGDIGASGKPGTSAEERLRIREADAAGFLETYTSWCNGDTWGVELQRIAPVCPCCAEEPEPETVESVGGFIGDDATGAADALLDLLPDGATLADVTAEEDGNPCAYYAPDVLAAAQELAEGRAAT